QITHQISSMLRRLFEINAQTYFMKLTGADEQITANRFKMPFVFHLIEEISRNFGYSLSLINIDHKAALNSTQRTAANILLDGQMQHAVDQAFTQCTASQGHTLNIQFGKNGYQDRQTTREH